MVSVTKLIDILNKPALVNWANRIGLDGIKIRDYQKKSQAKGTTSHKAVENYFNYGEVFDGYLELEKSIKGFDIIGCEVETDNGFICGRIDLVLQKDNEIYICDFKSTDAVYLSTKLQLSTYKHIFGADKIIFISLKDFKIKELKIDTDKYYGIIKRLYQINELLIKLNERL